MFDEAYGTLPEKPPTLSKEVYRERQARLLSQLDVDDLIMSPLYLSNEKQRCALSVPFLK